MTALGPAAVPDARQVWEAMGFCEDHPPHLDEMGLGDERDVAAAKSRRSDSMSVLAPSWSTRVSELASASSMHP